MLSGLGALMTSILTSAQTSLVIPIIGIGIFAGGVTWSLGDHHKGKSIVMAALIGGAFMLLALTIATAFNALPRG